MSTRPDPCGLGILYVVTEVLSPSLFHVVDQKREQIMHYDRLMLCDDRIVPLWARRKRHLILESNVSQHPNQDDQDLGDEPVIVDKDVGVDRGVGGSHDLRKGAESGYKRTVQWNQTLL